VAKITWRGLPIFANERIGADQDRYFPCNGLRPPHPELIEPGGLCLALPKIRVTVADALSADH
jgi:hypothetical protein